MKLAHSADWHICCRKYADTRLQEDFLKAAQDVVQTCVQEGVNALLVSGDIMHTNQVASTHPYELKKIHRYAIENNLPILTIPGNHDMAVPHWSSVLQERELNPDEVLQAGRCGGFYCVRGKRVYVEDAAGKRVSVYGSPVTNKQALKELDVPECDFFMYHGPVREFFGLGDVESYPSIEDFPLQRISQYIALGDIHKLDVRQSVHSGPLIGYPGSTNSVTKAEQDKKHFVLFDVDKPEISYRRVHSGRETYRVYIHSEEDLQKAMEKGGPLDSSDEKRLVYITYPSSMTGLMGRVRGHVKTATTIIDPSPVYLPTAASKASSSGEDDPSEDIAGLTFVSMLKDMSSGDADLCSLVLNLASPEANAADVLDKWTDEQLRKAGLDYEEVAALNDTAGEQQMPPAPPPSV